MWEVRKLSVGKSYIKLENSLWVCFKQTLDLGIDCLLKIRDLRSPIRGMARPRIENFKWGNIWKYLVFEELNLKSLDFWIIFITMKCRFVVIQKLWLIRNDRKIFRRKVCMRSFFVAWAILQVFVARRPSCLFWLHGDGFLLHLHQSCKPKWLQRLS